MTTPQRAYKGLCHVCLRSNVDTIVDQKPGPNQGKPICLDCKHHRDKPKEEPTNAA